MSVLSDAPAVIAKQQPAEISQPRKGREIGFLILFLVFTGYILSFLLDLLPSIRSRSHLPQGWRNQVDLEKANLTNGNSNASTPVTTDSQGPNADGGDLIGHGAHHHHHHHADNASSLDNRQ